MSIQFCVNTNRRERQYAMRFNSWCGGGTVMPPALTFRYYELRRSLISQKLIIQDLPGKIPRNSNLLFKLRYIKKTLFWPTTPYGRLCNSAHTCPNMLRLTQKLKLIEFSSLQKLWWGNTNFPREGYLIARPDVSYTGFYRQKRTAKSL